MSCIYCKIAYIVASVNYIYEISHIILVLPEIILLALSIVHILAACFVLA